MQFIAKIFIYIHKIMFAPQSIDLFEKLAESLLSNFHRENILLKLKIKKLLRKISSKNLTAGVSFQKSYYSPAVALFILSRVINQGPSIKGHNKGQFCPHRPSMRTKNKNCFSPTSSGRFIRTNVQL